MPPCRRPAATAAAAAAAAAAAKKEITTNKQLQASGRCMEKALKALNKHWLVGRHHLALAVYHLPL
eukprot:1159251-Pelagomonas_calceolata.AAC.6